MQAKSKSNVPPLALNVEGSYSLLFRDSNDTGSSPSQCSLAFPARNTSTTTAAAAAAAAAAATEAYPAADIEAVASSSLSSLLSSSSSSSPLQPQYRISTPLLPHLSPLTPIDPLTPLTPSAITKAAMSSASSNSSPTTTATTSPLEDHSQPSSPDGSPRLDSIRITNTKRYATQFSAMAFSFSQDVTTPTTTTSCLTSTQHPNTPTVDDIQPLGDEAHACESTGCTTTPQQQRRYSRRKPPATPAGSGNNNNSSNGNNEWGSAGGFGRSGRFGSPWSARMHSEAREPTSPLRLHPSPSFNFSIAVTHSKGKEVDRNMSPPPFRLPGHNKASEPGDSAIPVAAAAAVAAKSLPLAPSASIASTATTSATTPPRVTDRRQSKTRSLHKRVVSDPELASRPPSSLLLNQDSTSHSPVGAGGSIRNNWNSPSSPNDAIEAFRTISRAMRGLKLPSSPHSTHRSHTSPNSDAISLAQSQILSEVEVEAIKNANDILDKHFSPGNAGSSWSKLNPRRRYQIYPHSQSTTSLDRAPFQSAAPTPALSALSCESVLRDRHDSIMTINFSEDVNTDSPFDAEASIKGHQVAKRARKVEKLLGTDVDKSAIIKSFKKQNKLWFLEPTYEKFDISFDMEGNVDGGTWDALIEYLTPPHPTPQDYEITFLLTFRAFATPRQFCDALIRRYRQQPPPGLGIHEIKLWQEKMQRVVQMKVYHIFRSWYEIYWFGAEDDECLPRVTEFLSTEVSKNPKLTGNKLRMCHKLIAKMEERMRNESNWLSHGNAPHTQHDMPRHAVDTAATSRRRPSASNPTSTSHGLSLFRRPIKIGHSNSPPRSAHLQQSPSLGTRNHNFLFNRLRSHSQNNSSTSSKPRNEHALFSGSLFNSRRNGQQQQQQQDDHTVVAIRAKSGSDVSIRYQQQQMPEPLQSDPQSLRFRPRRPSEASIRSVDSSGSYVDSNTQGSDVEAEVAELLRVTVGVDLTFDMLRRMSNITQLPPNQIAIQITILQSGCFCKIQPYELLRGEFSKKNSLAANVKNMTKWNTQISRWVSYSILKEQTPERRCRILKYFIRVGAECLHMKNYDAVMAIQGALNSAAVLRLKKTWALLPSKLNRVNTRLQMATKSDRNYSEYRRMLRNSEPPLLPFLGMYLTDLTFINDGNPDMRRRKLVSAVGMDDKTWEKQREHENLKAKAINTSTLANKDDIDITSKAILINFDKYYKIARIIREIQKFQVEYKGNFLTTMPALSDYLVSEWDRLDEEGIDEDLLYNMSLKREPREVVLQPQPPPPSAVCSSSVASLGSGGGGSGHGQNNIASQSKVSPPSDNGHKQSSQLPSQPLTKEQEILDIYMNW